MVKLYSAPQCGKCTMTEARLKKLGIAYEKIDIKDNPVAYEYITSLGYKSLPVVVDGDRHWSGFDPEKIAQCQS